MEYLSAFQKIKLEILAVFVLNQSDSFLDAF